MDDRTMELLIEMAGIGLDASDREELSDDEEETLAQVLAHIRSTGRIINGR